MGHGPRGYPRTWQRPLIQPEGQQPWTMSLFSGYSVVALVSLKGAPWCTWVSGLSGDSHLTLGTLASPTLPGCAQPSSWPTLGTSLAQLPWSSQMGLRSKRSCYLKKKILLQAWPPSPCCSAPFSYSKLERERECHGFEMSRDSVPQRPWEICSATLTPV